MIMHFCEQVVLSHFTSSCDNISNPKSMLSFTFSTSATKKQCHQKHLLTIHLISFSKQCYNAQQCFQSYNDNGKRFPSFRRYSTANCRSVRTVRPVRNVRSVWLLRNRRYLRNGRYVRYVRMETRLYSGLLN